MRFYRPQLFKKVSLFYTICLFTVDDRTNVPLLFGCSRELGPTTWRLDKGDAKGGCSEHLACPSRSLCITLPLVSPADMVR